MSAKKPSWKIERPGVRRLIGSCLTIHYTDDGRFQVIEDAYSRGVCDLLSQATELAELISSDRVAMGLDP